LLQKLIFLLLLAVIASAQAKDSLSLDELRWKNRLVLTFSDDIEWNRAALSELKKNIEKINDRDIVYFIIGSDTIYSNHQKDLSGAKVRRLKEKFAKDKSNFVVLYGKDGGVKWKNEELDLDHIFNLIDRMPMRQREMREKRTSD